MFRNPTEIRDAYRDETVAREYVGRRFQEPIGAMLHERQVAAVLALAAQHAGRILELAPGPARLTSDLAPSLGGRLVAVDASFQMLGEARRRLAAERQAVRFVQGDAFALPFAGPFALAYSFRLIRHFADEDRLRMYRELHRVLAPGGVLVFDAINRVVSAPLRARRPDEYKHYDALLDAAAVRRELTGCGFTDVELHGVQHRFGALAALQVYVAPRSRPLARTLMEVVERTGGEPLEWIVRCRRG